MPASNQERTTAFKNETHHSSQPFIMVDDSSDETHIAFCNVHI